ncbi:MAG: hypothetical protein ACYS22_09545, partial [Planctomycetota bacterium]
MDLSKIYSSIQQGFAEGVENIQKNAEAAQGGSDSGSAPEGAVADPDRQKMLGESGVYGSAREALLLDRIGGPVGEPETVQLSSAPDVGASVKDLIERKTDRSNAKYLFDNAAARKAAIAIGDEIAPDHLGQSDAAAPARFERSLEALEGLKGRGAIDGNQAQRLSYELLEHYTDQAGAHTDTAAPANNNLYRQRLRSMRETFEGSGLSGALANVDTDGDTFSDALELTTPGLLQGVDDRAVGLQRGDYGAHSAIRERTAERASLLAPAVPPGHAPFTTWFGDEGNELVNDASDGTLEVGFGNPLTIDAEKVRGGQGQSYRYPDQMRSVRSIGFGKGKVSVNPSPDKRFGKADLRYTGPGKDMTVRVKRDDQGHLDYSVLQGRNEVPLDKLSIADSQRAGDIISVWNEARDVVGSGETRRSPDEVLELGRAISDEVDPEIEATLATAHDKIESAVTSKFDAIEGRMDRLDAAAETATTAVQEAISHIEPFTSRGLVTVSERNGELQAS